MSNTATRLYYVGVIERAITYYEVEAEDARAAAENWQDGEFYDRDDEALDTEGPCSVGEQTPDGTWRKVPPSEWKDRTAAEHAAPRKGDEASAPAPWHMVNPTGMPEIRWGEVSIADIRLNGHNLEHGEAHSRRMVAALNACENLSTEQLEHGVIADAFDALADLLGDMPDVQRGECIRCGRQYEDIDEGECPSDNCPSWRARALLRMQSVPLPNRCKS
jgi:hypothetical protein